MDWYGSEKDGVKKWGKDSKRRDIYFYSVKELRLAIAQKEKERGKKQLEREIHALLDRQEEKASTSAKVFLCIALVGPHLQ